MCHIVTCPSGNSEILLSSTCQTGSEMWVVHKLRGSRPRRGAQCCGKTHEPMKMSTLLKEVCSMWMEESLSESLKKT